MVADFHGYFSKGDNSNIWIVNSENKQILSDRGSVYSAQLSPNLAIFFSKAYSFTVILALFVENLNTISWPGVICFTYTANFFQISQVSPRFKFCLQANHF